MLAATVVRPSMLICVSKVLLLVLVVMGMVGMTDAVGHGGHGGGGVGEAEAAFDDEEGAGCEPDGDVEADAAVPVEGDTGGADDGEDVGAGDGEDDVSTSGLRHVLKHPLRTSPPSPPFPPSGLSAPGGFRPP